MDCRKVSVHLLNADEDSVIRHESSVNAHIAFRIRQEQSEDMARFFANIKGVDDLLAIMPSIKGTNIKLLAITRGKHASIFSEQLNNYDVDKLMDFAFSKEENEIVIAESAGESFFRISLYKGNKRIAGIIAESKETDAPISLSIDGNETIASVFEIAESDLLTALNGKLSDIKINLDRLLGLPFLLSAEEIAKKPKKYGADVLSYYI